MSLAKILVVDDELELPRLLKQRFRRQILAQQYEFTFANNGVEALQKIQAAGNFDLVLTDINMPEMDGLTLLHHLNAHCQNQGKATKTVILSAYNDMAHIRQAMNEGAYDFVTKPINFADLEATIDKTLTAVDRLKTQQAQLQKTQEKLQQAAFEDALTGLPNRAWLNQYLPQLLLQQYSEADLVTALLFIDVDGFKQINDCFGHIAGDRLLQAIAQRLRSCLRQGDVAVRLGGDEFIVLLPMITHVEVAVAVAERIQEQFTPLFQILNQDIGVSVSIGIALTQNHQENPEQILQAADHAMYTAKAQGKGHYAFLDAHR